MLLVHARLPINLLASPGKHNVSMTYLYRNVVCATTTVVAGILLFKNSWSHSWARPNYFTNQLQLLTTLPAKLQTAKT